MRAAMPRLATLAATVYSLPLARAEPPPPPVKAPLPRTDSTVLFSTPDQRRTSNPDDMVPITRELLSRHYRKFPDPSVSDDLRALRVRMKALREAAGRHADVDSILAEQLPSGLDSSMYKARCACEEAAERVEETPTLAALQARLRGCAHKFEHFQIKQREHVNSVIDQFLPQDFRASLFTAAKNNSEKRNAQAMRDLIAAGGTVRDKYKLLWEQQWRRRENLAAVGNATGVWKLLVRYLAGVPQPLLTFAKNINAKDGPTEALREKFGAALAELASFAIAMNALCAAAAKAGGDEAAARLLQESLQVYEREIDAFVKLLQRVITNSPFFIDPDQIEAAGRSKVKPLHS